ncbi:MAG TPA: type II secretion system F family protein [Oceanipulchritudo sp.]|nr:type II secretion system F family protein [Oceanipulchritudo sp.]
MANTSAAAAPGRSSSASSRRRVSFWESQRLAKQKQYEKQARKKKIKLEALTVFTQQLSSMLEAGLPLVSALEALQDQTENPVFQIIIRNVKMDISGGTAFSEAVAKYPNAFPNLFTSMVEAGEASGGLASILGKVAIYFEDTVKLIKQVKSAMTYPIAVIGLAVVLVQVLLIFVIPVFADMFSSFGKELPKPTQLLISTSNFLKAYIIYIIIGLIVFWNVMQRILKTPKGRRAKDVVLLKVPIVGPLIQKIALSRFCRTYAILLRSGVPILRTLEIVSNASGNTFIERSCKEISKNISQGGQLSETLSEIPYFPPTVKHMARAGEQTGNVDGMMAKIADFYDAEVETTVDALTSLMEPALIVFLGVVIGSIVMAMFLPIFNLAGVVGG